MDKQITKYAVKKIDENSDHDAVNYLEDECLIIVEDSKGNWWKADEFFMIESISEFFVEIELG